MLKHLEFVRRTHKDVELLSKKEVKYLQDKLANSDGSDYEPKQYNEVFGPTKRKIHSQRRRRTLGMVMVSRKSTGFAKNILIHWERELLRFKGALKKLKKTLSFEYPYIINPDGSPKLLWDLLCLSIVIYSIISIPLEMSFDVIVSDEFDITITVIFFFDIFLNFNTGVYQNGTLRMDRRIILKDYFKVWFWVDSISTIPYDEIIDSGAGYAKSARLLSLVKFLKFVKILRLLRLAKLKIMFDKLDQLLQVNKSMAIALTFFKLFLFVIFFAHILGCGFHFLGSNELEQGSWLQPYWDQPWYIRYIESLYWGVTTMVTVGYGDISPQSPAERTLGVFLLLLACGGFAFTMNSIGTALKQIGEKSEITKQRMSGVNRYMKQAKIADGLQNRIRKYLEYVWDSNKTMTINDMTATLSGDLSSKIRQQVNGKMLSYVDLFWTHFTKQFLLELVPLVNENLYCPQELIINEDQFDYDLFIVQNGEVEIFYLKTDVVMDKKIKGDYFGEVSFFSDKPRSASARSHDFSNIFVVKQKIFIDLCRKYPNDCEKFFYLRHKIVFQNDYSCINIRCYTCQMDDHVARYCPSLHFTVVAHHFLEFQKQAARLTQSIFVRKDRIDYHAWLHNQTIQQCQIRHKNHFVKKTQYIESSRKFRINDDDEHVSEEDIINDDYRVLNQMNKLSINNKKFKPKKTYMTRQQSGLVNNSMLSEEDLLIEKIAMQRIQQYVAEFQRRKSFKYYWVEFSDLPGLDKQQEYELFFPKHNFSRQVQTYEKWIEFKDESQNDNEIFNKHEFGVEELKVYSQYYGHQIDYFDLDKQLSKSHHADHISYDQKRILRLDRRTKKKYKHIPEPTKVFNKSFIVLKAIKHFKRASVNKSELNIINEQGYKGMVEIMGKEIQQLLGLLDIKQKEIDSLVRQSSQYRLIEEKEKYKLQAQLDNFVKESTYQKQLNQEIQIQKETELFQQYEKEVDKIKHQDRIIRNLQQDINNLRQSNQNQLEKLSTFEKLIQEKDKLRKDIEETHKIEKESWMNQQQLIKTNLDVMVTDNKKLQEIVQYQECQINNLKSQIKESAVINQTTLYDLSFDQKRLKDQTQSLLMQIDSLTHLCQKQEFKLADQQLYIDKLIHQLNQNRSTQGSLMEDFKRRMEQSSILQVENLKLSYGTQVCIL